MIVHWRLYATNLVLPTSGLSLLINQCVMKTSTQRFFETQNVSLIAGFFFVCNVFQVRLNDFLFIQKLWHQVDSNPPRALPNFFFYIAILFPFPISKLLCFHFSVQFSPVLGQLPKSMILTS